MKKVIALLIAVSMVFCFAACGNKTAQTQVVDSREAYENLQLSLGSGLPKITMWGTYYLNEIQDDYAADGMVASYYTELPSEPDYDFYQWEKGDRTLDEIAVTKITKRSSRESVSDFYRFDTWEESDGYDYYYYAQYQELEGKAYIVQSYFFESEEYFVAVDRWNECQAIETGIDGFTINLPVMCTQAEVSADAPDTLVSAYYDESENFPLTFIYNWDGAYDYDAVVKEISKDVNVKYAGKMTYTAADGTAYPGGVVQFTENEGEALYSENEYFIMLNDKVLLFNYLSFGEGTLSAIAVPALFAAVQAK